MQRPLALLALTAAAFVPAPAANANHLCVTSGGSPVYCAPHVYTEDPKEICVTSGGRDIVCVF